MGCFKAWSECVASYSLQPLSQPGRLCPALLAPLTNDCSAHNLILAHPPPDLLRQLQNLRVGGTELVVLEQLAGDGGAGTRPASLR